jgi:hypothetical protein
VSQNGRDWNKGHRISCATEIDHSLRCNCGLIDYDEEEHQKESWPSTGSEVDSLIWALKGYYEFILSDLSPDIEKHLVSIKHKGFQSRVFGAKGLIDRVRRLRDSADDLWVEIISDNCFDDNPSVQEYTSALYEKIESELERQFKRLRESIISVRNPPQLEEPS